MKTRTPLDVEAIFRDAGALREGHFVLASGRHSARYLEKFHVLQYPRETERLAAAIADWARTLGVATVAGPTTGGIILAHEVARQLDPMLRLLVQHHVARLNGCGFCVDIGRAAAVQHRVDLGKIDAVSEYRGNPLFTERERAALAYVEEATRNKRVADATFEALRRHCDDREIVEITWLCAVENYFNLVNLPLEIESDGLCAIATRRRAA